MLGRYLQNLGEGWYTVSWYNIMILCEEFFSSRGYHRGYHRDCRSELSEAGLHGYIRYGQSRRRNGPCLYPITILFRSMIHGLGRDVLDNLSRLRLWRKPRRTSGDDSISRLEEHLQQMHTSCVGPRQTQTCAEVCRHCCQCPGTSLNAVHNDHSLRAVETTECR